MSENTGNNIPEGQYSSGGHSNKSSVTKHERTLDRPALSYSKDNRREKNKTSPAESEEKEHL